MFVVWTIPKSRNPRIWLICLGVATLGLLGVIGIDLFDYNAFKGPMDKSFNRAVFAVIMSTDWPLVALVIGSIINWTISKRALKANKTNAAPTVKVKDGVEPVLIKASDAESEQQPGPFSGSDHEASNQ